MKSRRLLAKLSPERDDLIILRISAGAPSLQRIALQTWLRRRLRADVFALVRVEGGVLQAGNAKGECIIAIAIGPHIEAKMPMLWLASEPPVWRILLYAALARKASEGIPFAGDGRV